MNHEEKIKSAMRLHEYVRDWRGRIINSVSVIELQLAQIISKFFAKEDRFHLFFSEIATSYSMNFRKKRELLKLIFEQDPFLETSPDRKLVRELEEIGSFRNLLAHSVLDVSDAALARTPQIGVGFVSYKGGKQEIKVISEADFNDWNGRIGTVVGLVGDTMRQLGLNSSAIP